MKAIGAQRIFASIYARVPWHITKISDWEGWHMLKQPCAGSYLDKAQRILQVRRWDRYRIERGNANYGTKPAYFWWCPQFTRTLRCQRYKHLEGNRHVQGSFARPHVVGDGVSSKTVETSGIKTTSETILRSIRCDRYQLDLVDTSIA